MTTLKKYILGIDISKRHFDVALMLLNNKQKHKKFSNDPKGFEALKSWLLQFDIDRLHACMEATNIYGNKLAEYLYDLDYEVSIVNPISIKGFAQSELNRTKTDKQDASLIARFCVAMSPRLWEPEPQNVRILKALVHRVDALVDMRQQEVNRLDVAEAIVANDIQQHIELLTKQIELLRKTIQQHIDDDPDLKAQKELLLSIPGVGEKTIAVLLSNFANVQRFGSAKKMASFCGVTPRICDSGSSINKYRRMSKTGAAYIRKALFFPAMVALRYNPILQELQRRLLKAGKPKMVIIGAAMRKLVHLIYGVLTSKQPFNPEMVKKELAS